MRRKRETRYTIPNSPLNQWKLTLYYKQFPSEQEGRYWREIIKIFYGENFDGKPIDKMDLDFAFHIAKRLYDNSWRNIRRLDKGEKTILGTLHKLERAKTPEERFRLEDLASQQMEHLNYRCGSALDSEDEYYEILVLDEERHKDLTFRRHIVRDYKRLTRQEEYDLPVRKIREPKRKTTPKKPPRQGRLFS